MEHLRLKVAAYYQGVRGKNVSARRNFFPGAVVVVCNVTLATLTLGPCRLALKGKASATAT